MSTEHGHWTAADGSDLDPGEEETEITEPTERDRILAELAALHRLHKAAPLLLSSLCDCVAVMERELHGLAVIQPELRAARAAIALTEPPKER